MNEDKLTYQRVVPKPEERRSHQISRNLISDIKCEGNDKTYMRKPDLEYENFKNREEEKLKEYARIENKRREKLNRDEERWNKEERAAQIEMEKTQKLQKMRFKSEKNKSKSSRDIITHEYRDNADASAAEKKKQVVTQSRKQMLTSKTSSSYNPITGEERKF